MELIDDVLRVQESRLHRRIHRGIVSWMLGHPRFDPLDPSSAFYVIRAFFLEERAPGLISLLVAVAPRARQDTVHRPISATALEVIEVTRSARTVDVNSAVGAARVEVPPEGVLQGRRQAGVDDLRERPAHDVLRLRDSGHWVLVSWAVATI